MIRVLLKKENEYMWENIDISDSEGLHDILGDSVEQISLPYNIILWKKDDLPYSGHNQVNIMLMWDINKEYHQYILGPIVLSGIDENQTITTLNELQRRWLAHHLKSGQLSNGSKISVIDLTDGGAIA